MREGLQDQDFKSERGKKIRIPGDYSGGKPWNRNKFHASSNGSRNNLDNNQVNSLILLFEVIQLKREENFNSFIAKIKFQSKVATVSDEKCKHTYIDLEATHYFFNSKSSFINHERIEPQSVEVASSTSKFVGKGIIKLSVENSTIIGAYRAPEF